MEKETNTVTVRTHRVGAVTTGLCMVGFGTVLLLHTMFGLMNYEAIMGLWPLILIGLGIELLLSNIWKGKIVYDKAAIVLLFVMTLFAVMLAGMDMAMEAFGHQMADFVH